jgi:hypothetical protein
MDCNWKWFALLCGITVCAPVSLLAQSVELGGMIGSGARGTENSFARAEAQPMWGAYGSVWWADRFETVFRVAWVDRHDPIGSSTYYFGCAARLNFTGRVARSSHWSKRQ